MYKNHHTIHEGVQCPTSQAVMFQSGTIHISAGHEAKRNGHGLLRLQ